MTVTTSYSATPTLGPTSADSLTLNSPQSAITALTGGGFALAVQDSQGYTDLDIYNANGTLNEQNTEFHATDAKIIQLTNGNILIAGTTTTGSIDYRIYSVQGKDIGGGTFGRDTNASNVSLSATANGGFAAAYQKSYASDDNDVWYDVFNSAGASIGNSSRDTSGANDQNGVMVQLAGGNYALAWDRTDGSTGNTSVYYMVLNSSFGVVKAETVLDASGTVNKTPSITALQNGGFTVSYENNSYSTNGTGPSDIVAFNLSATGAVSSGGRQDTYTPEDSQPSSATLSDGTVVTAFTDVFNATDNDIDFAAEDPSTGIVLGANNLPGADTGAVENNPSVSALANDQFAVSYTVSGGGNSITKFSVYQLTRYTAGDNAGDTIIGDAKRDIISTGSGNDVFTPGNGADNAVTAQGGFDTVIFSGARAGYTINRNGNVTVVTRPDGGTDALYNVEKLQFTDQNLFTPIAPRAFDSIGHSSLLLQNTNGQMAVWQLNGSVTPTTYVEPNNPGSVWQIKGSGDFDADLNTDILLQDSATGALNIWTMNGTTRAASTMLATNAGPTWHAVTTGDFNADGRADILLQNDSGQVAVWLMNGTTITTKSVFSSNPGSAWHALDTGDFNNDGKSDILFQNSTDGSIMVWTMNGGTMLGQTAISTSPGTAWQVKSSGDFNGDGKSDILMQNSGTGQVVIWTMNGTTVSSKTALVNNPGTSWHVLGTGDFNGDGKSDIELQNSSGQIALWMMNGTTIASTIILSNNPGTAWHVAAGTGG